MDFFLTPVDKLGAGHKPLSPETEGCLGVERGEC